MQNPNVGRPNSPSAKGGDEPIRLDELDVTIPFDDSDEQTAGVSHVPLELGGDSGTPRGEQPSPAVVRRPAEKIVSAERITGVKTFFTKLHPGAMAFLDEQIAIWLKQNPGVDIKQTNITTGEVQAKKTEPNLIIAVWY